MNAFCTIDGFESLTAQQVFDMSKKHLLEQNKKSTHVDGTCMYRAKKGLMCAAGIFLKDERAEECEMNDWNYLVYYGFVPDNNCELIYGLQYVHDGCTVEEWPEELEQLAKHYSLIY